MKKSLLAAACVASGVLAACGGAEGLESVEHEQVPLATRVDKYTAHQALDTLNDIGGYAPPLPSNTPDALLNITFDGLPYNLRTLLANASDPYRTTKAYINGVLRTGPTVASPLPFGNAYPGAPSTFQPVSLFPEYTRSAPAAQVYECRSNGSGGYAWTFIRPEASLTPVTTQPIRNPDSVSFDHFRYPGGITYVREFPVTPPAGPAWRLSSPAYNDGITTWGQEIFVGAVDVSVPNGTGNIPLLRVRNAETAFSGVLPGPITPTARPYFETYVLRLNTQGGVAPTTGCSTAADVGRRHRSPYSCDYYFIQVIETAYYNNG